MPSETNPYRQYIWENRGAPDNADVDRFAVVIIDETPSAFGPGIKCASVNDDPITEILAVGSLPTIGVWEHYACVFDKVAGLISIYKNGQLVDEAAWTNPIQGRSEGVKRIGTINPANSPGQDHHLKGMLDEFEVYRRGLIATEIQAIYDSGRTGKNPPLKGLQLWLPFDRDDADVSGKGHIPELIGGAALVGGGPTGELVGVGGGPDNLTISHNVFDTTGDATTTRSLGITVPGGGASNLLIEFNTFVIDSDSSSGLDVAIEANNLVDARILNNSFQGDMSEPRAGLGIAIDLVMVSSTPNGTTTIEANSISMIGTGIRVRHGFDVLIADNNIFDVSRGIVLTHSDSGNAFDNNVIDNSVAFGMGGLGINLTYTSNEAVTNNVINNFAAGIRGLNVASTVVSDNNITTLSRGIVMDGANGDFHDIQIVNNAITNTTGTVPFTDVGPTTMAIQLNQHPSGGLTTQNRVVNNTTTNFTYGVRGRNVADSQIRDNLIQESVRGIQLDGDGGLSGENVDVSFNTVASSVDVGEYGIYLLIDAGARVKVSGTHTSGGTLKKCVNSQAVYPLSEQDGLEAQERRYTAHEEGKH